MKEAVLYIRVRGEEHLQEAIDRQISICQKYANENGWTVVKTYIEKEELGKPTNRVILAQLMEDSKIAKWEAVITSSYDRMTRNLKQFVEYMESLRSNGKNLLIPSSEIHNLPFTYYGNSPLIGSKR